MIALLLLLGCGAGAAVLAVRWVRRATKARPSPVAWRTADGTFYDHDGAAWLYFVMPLRPLLWEDQKARMEHASTLHHMFCELGGTSKSSVVAGTSIGAFYRSFHLLALAWDVPARPPQDVAEEVKHWLQPMFGEFLVGRGLFAIGVHLRRASPLSGSGALSAMRGVIRDAVGAQAPDRRAYQADRGAVGQILARAGGRPPTAAEADRIESWWNGGRGADGTINAEPDGMSVSTDMWPEGLEMSTLLEFEETQLHPEHGLWLADAFGHDQGCVAVSVRGNLVPSETARAQFRKSQRKAISRIKEQAATGDLEREEDSRLLESSAMLESLFVEGREPLVRDCSVVFARRASKSDETYADMLSAKWGLRTKQFEYRQVEALWETLPCGRRHGGSKGTFAHDLTIGMLAASGIGAFNEVGDESGVWIGVSPPDAALVWLDPLGASKQNKPPSMAVVGEPGAGKTFLLQLIASQSCLAGRPCVFINPKAADSLAGCAAAVGGDVVNVSAMSKEPGMLDPFSYAAPEIAADLAVSHVDLVMANILSDEERIYVAAGIKEGALRGARCVGDALQNDRVPQRVAELVRLQAETRPLFGIGIGFAPRAGSAMKTARGRLTLVEFDRAIQMPAHFGPTAAFSMEERCAIAAIRLITRAALEQMLTGDGGVLILDEAHVFLSSQEGRAILQNLGRTGRSQGILPIMATQRLADLISEGVDMHSYLGRSIVMKMTDPAETAAALSLCGLEATEDRRDFLAHAGPIHDKEHPENSCGARALHRDLNGRVSSILVGPVPEEVRLRFSTNILDRQTRSEAAM